MYGKVKLHHPHENVKDTKGHSKSIRFSKESPVPSGLVFAVLDDNNLVRMSVMRSLMAAPVSCNKTSFAWGSTSRECLDFAKELLDRNVDVAIFDQNLDYDDNNQDLRLKGTELAKMARKQGYKGAIVLHSANEYLLSIHEAEAFDGFVAKTASKREFLEGVNRAWNAHLRHRAAAAAAGEKF